MKILLALILSISSLQAALVGKKAPSFELLNENNKTVKLSDYSGKTVVLEWLNHGCPFIKKHYNSKNMQNTQKKVIDENTVWLSIISSAKGEQGYSTPAEAKSNKVKHSSLASHILIDESGKVGRLYNAKTTPHMFIIDKSGTVVYEGAIDSISSADESDIAQAKNYVLEAFKQLRSNQKISESKTRPYGCSVKY